MTDFHMHTTLCDGADTIEAMAKAAYEAGFSAIGFSGHSYTGFDDSWCMSRERTLEYISGVLQQRRLYAGRMEIYLGVERDIYSTEPAGSFDYSIGSVHFIEKNGEYLPVDESADVQRALVAKYYGGDFYAFVADYYDTVKKLPEAVEPDIIGHFDLVTKFNQNGALFDETDRRYLDAAEDALRFVADRCGVFEINTGAVARGYRREPYPSLNLLRLIKSCGADIMINSDAHKAADIGFMRSRAVELAHEAGFDTEIIMTSGGLREISLK